MNGEINQSEQKLQQKSRFNFLHYVGFTLLAILFIKNLKPILTAEYTIDIYDILFLIFGLGFLAHGFKQYAKTYQEKKDKKITRYFKIAFYIIGGFLFVFPLSGIVDFGCEFCFIGIFIIWAIGLVFVIMAMFL